VYKTRITDLNELKQRLRTEWAKLDNVVIAAAIRQWRRSLKAGGEHFSVSDFCYCTISDYFAADVDNMNSCAIFVGLLLHTVCSGAVM